MKTLLASVFALTLLGAGVASADGIGLGVHVGPIGVGAHAGGEGVGAGAHVGGVGAGVGLHGYHRHCSSWRWHDHERYCRRW